MEILFEALCPQMPNIALETLDFIEEDESTTMGDLVSYFQQLIESAVPEEIRAMEVYRSTLSYVSVENLCLNENANARKEFLIKCYREAVLFANILVVKNRLMCDKQDVLVF